MVMLVCSCSKYLVSSTDVKTRNIYFDSISKAMISV